jgi:hypothetical protein
MSDENKPEVQEEVKVEQVAESEKVEVKEEAQPEPEKTKRKLDRDDIRGTIKAAMKGEKVDYKDYNEQKLTRERKAKPVAGPVEEVKQAEPEAPAKAETPLVEAPEKPAGPVGAEQPPEPFAMPISWAKEKAQYWEKLPREVQAYVKSREDERDNYLNRIKSEHDTATRYVTDVAKVIEPHTPLLKSIGVNPIQAIEAVMSDAAIAYVGTPQQKIDLVKRVFQTTGLNPAEVFGEGIDNPANTGVNGASSSAELATLRAQLQAAHAQLDAVRQQSEQTQLSTVRNSVATTVSELASEKGADGKVLRPYFEQLQSPIAKIAKSLTDYEIGLGKQPDYRAILAEAYEIALSRDPEIKAQREAEAKAELQRKNEEAARAAKAKAMNTPKVTGIAGISQKEGKPRSFREELQARLAQANGE